MPRHCQARGQPGPEGRLFTLASTAATHTVGGGCGGRAREIALEPYCQRVQLEGPCLALLHVCLVGCTFSHGISHSDGGADCTLCSPGEADRTPTPFPMPDLLDNGVHLTTVDLGCLEDVVPGNGHGAQCCWPFSSLSVAAGPGGLCARRVLGLLSGDALGSDMSALLGMVSVSGAEAGICASSLAVGQTWPFVPWCLTGSGI